MALEFFLVHFWKRMRGRMEKGTTTTILEDFLLNWRTKGNNAQISDIIAASCLAMSNCVCVSGSGGKNNKTKRNHS